MHATEHTKNSLKRLEEKDSSQLYHFVPKIIEEIVRETHLAMDSKSLVTKDSDKKLRSREILHHEEGIRTITEELSKQYGEIYRQLIEQEARAHVLEDMHFIPKKADYEDKTFWDRWKAQYETIMDV